MTPHGERGEDESGFLQDGVGAVDRLELCFVGGQAPPGGTQRRVQRRAGEGRGDDQRKRRPPRPAELDTACDQPQEQGGHRAHHGEHPVGAEPVQETAAQRGAESDDEGVAAERRGGSGVAVGLGESQEQGDGQHGGGGAGQEGDGEEAAYGRAGQEPQHALALRWGRTEGAFTARAPHCDSQPAAGGAGCSGSGVLAWKPWHGRPALGQGHVRGSWCWALQAGQFA